MRKGKGQRVAAGVEYCGVGYCGWQVQRGVDSVQGRVEEAVGRVAGVAGVGGEGVRVVCAGRTDTGVHGIGQVIHFDVGRARAMQAWVRGVNSYLPDDISLVWAREVGGDFHARFSAVQRRYRYVILNRGVSPSYLHGRVGWHYVPLEVGRMQEAAGALVGEHDFSAFRAAGCQAKSARRTVSEVCVERCGDWVWVDISADGFLQRMVRNIVGALVRVGEGREAVGWLGELLRERQRAQDCGAASAPAAGLYLTGVEYEARFGLPQPPSACRFW